MPKSLALLVVITLICSTVILAEKHSLESNNCWVELAADYDLFAEYKQLDLLSRYSPDIISSLAVTEKSLLDLAAANQISIYNGWQLQSLIDLGLETTAVNSDRIYINGPSKPLKQIAKRLKLLAGNDYSPRQKQLVIKQSEVDLLTKAVYFNEQALNFVQTKKLSLIPRFKASTTVQELALMLKQLPPIKTIIFSGQEVLGYPNELEVTATKLQQGEVQLGLIEPFLAQQLGAKSLAAQMDYQAVRVHSIKQEELEQLGVKKTVTRYVKAVQERNVRLLYIKPFTKASHTIALITSLKEKLEQQNYQLTVAQAFAEAKNRKFLKTIIISLILLTVSLLLKKINLKLAVIILSSGLMSLLLAHLWLWDTVILFWGLLVAILVPTAEYIYLWLKVRKVSGLKNYWLFLLVTGGSIITGLVITALLFDNGHLLQTKQFRGVKIAFLIPLFLSIIYYFSSRVKSKFEYESKSEFKEQLQEYIIKTVNRPLLKKDVLLGSGLLLLGLIYIGRTGNQFWLGISKFEVVIRNYLAEIFTVRPRFKSFLIGHPLLLLGITRGQDKYQPWLLLGGLIGQITIINTLLHLHMPLQVSLLRVALGVLLGWLVYLLLTTGGDCLKSRVLKRIQ